MLSQLELKILPEREEFYLNTGLYIKFKLEYFDKDKVFNILFKNEVLDCYCVDCNKQSIFNFSDKNYIPTKLLSGGIEVPIQYSNDWKFNFLLNNVIYKVDFCCSRDKEHKISFFISLNNSTLSKIGQTPSFADLNNQENKKFKNILKEYFEEYYKAMGLYSHGVGVGSFVYLRRIIENFIIKPAYEKSKNNENWDDTKYQLSYVKDKIKMLKENLPKFLVENTIIYSILSKGIHELSEDECLKYFPVIKACLEQIFTEMINNKNLKVTEENLKNEIRKIENNLNK